MILIRDGVFVPCQVRSTTYLNVDPAMEYTSLSLQSTVSTPNSSILPSARTMSTIDSDAPELDPNNNQNAKTGMARESRWWINLAVHSFRFNVGFF